MLSSFKHCFLYFNQIKTYSIFWSEFLFLKSLFSQCEVYSINILPSLSPPCYHNTTWQYIIINIQQIWWKTTNYKPTAWDKQGKRLHYTHRDTEWYNYKSKTGANSNEKEASNELRDITRKLSDLNKKLENDPSEATRSEVLEAKELYNTKYKTYFNVQTA